MGSDNEAAAFLDGETQGRKRLANAGVVGDNAILKRHVEVDADEDAFALEIEIVDGEFVHDS